MAEFERHAASASRPERLATVLSGSYGLIQSLAVLIALAVAITLINPAFLSWVNITNLMAQMAPMLIVAAGMTVVMIAGEFDISIGSAVALTAAICAVVTTQYGGLAGVALSMVVGPAIGIINGLIVTKGKIPSFIATLGTMMMARSLAFVVTKGKVISGLPDSFTGFGGARLAGIPVSFVLAVGVFIIGWVLLTRSPFGKKVYAVGANHQVARLSGISVDAVKIAAFVLVGLTASIAGNVLLARIGAIQADTARGLEFEVIAAVVIGGTSLTGGHGNILRTIVGVFVIVLIRNFMNLARIDLFWQDFATGLIIIIAVLLDVLQKRIGARLATGARRAATSVSPANQMK
ncbi:ABC transporter permease [Mesorhizobium sp. KR9-304]|uniref:ABC transporter permease n=1 Tax=Mesorhizobium sp. KR9-304 TaxID=3156614 RepID=UPI0032B51036